MYRYRIRRVRFRRHPLIVLTVLSLIVSVWRLPAIAQTVTIAGLATDLQTAITVCLPDPGQNQLKLLGQYTDAPTSTTYVYLQVSPHELSVRDETVAIDESQFPLNPWYLIVSTSGSTCTVLNSPGLQKLSAIVPFDIGRQLELQRIQGVIADVGGIEKLKAMLFSFAGDTHHGLDRPESDTIRLSRETAWALQHLGIQLPDSVVVED